jgi:hypothetical protein
MVGVAGTLNCGARDANVCKLRWEWERTVLELERSVFVIPAKEFKGKRPHVASERRGLEDRGVVPGVDREFVFVWRKRVNNVDQEPVTR